MDLHKYGNTVGVKDGDYVLGPSGTIYEVRGQYMHPLSVFRTKGGSLDPLPLPSGDNRFTKVWDAETQTYVGPSLQS